MVKSKLQQNCIPEGWEKKPLSKLFKFKNGVNADKSSYGSGVKFINVMDILKSNFILASDIRGKVLLSEDLIKENLVIKGDVLFNRTSEVQEEIGLTSVYLDSERIVFGGFVIRGRATCDSLVDGFKKYCFSSNSVRREIIGRGQGAIRSNIGQGDLNKVSILIPPLVEQIRIVKILEDWDSYSEKLERKIDIKKNIKKGLMQQLLTGKRRLKGFTEPWKITKLGSLFKERKESRAGHLPLLSITADQGVIQQSSSNKKDTSNIDKSKYKRICPGDIGYNTMRMWQGRSAQSNLEGIISPAYTVITPQKNVCSRYFSYLFKTPRLAYLFFQKSQGLVSDTWNCKFEDFALVKYPIPNFDEQIAIADILSSADDEIKALEQKKNILKDQKIFLLNNLVTGKIRIPKSMKV